MAKSAVLQSLTVSEIIYTIKTNSVWQRNIVLLAISLTASIWLYSPDAQNSPSPQSASVDTMIPNGFSLVPIQVTNIEVLEQMIGRFAIVNLYSTINEVGQAFAKGVRLLRSPIHPEKVALLVPEKKAAQFVKHDAPFKVIIQNPNQPHSEEYLAPAKKRKIIYENTQPTK